LAEQGLRERYPGATVNVDIEGKSGSNVLKGRFKSIKVEMDKLKLDDLPFSSSKATKIGRAGRIELLLRNFTWNGLALEKADFKFQDVEYDLGAMKDRGELNIVRCGPATAYLKMTAASLNKLIGGKLKDVPGARLEVSEGKLRILGEKVVFGLGVPFEMSAVPTGRGAQIYLEQAQIKVGGVPLPALAVKPIMADVNPMFVFDVDNKWPFSVQMTQVLAQDNALEIFGSLPFKTPVNPSK